ncbi:hypothetical protein Ddc_01305 [Ditylenchus destructor]|nr:hypothetical protein Ddc_01305 [Ditylenchus destructor]
MICPKLVRLRRPYELISRRFYNDKPKDWDNDPFLKFFTTKRDPYHEQCNSKFVKWWNRTFALEPRNMYYLTFGMFLFYCSVPRLYHIYPKLTLSDEEYREWLSRLNYVFEERQQFRRWYIPFYHDYVPSRGAVYEPEKEKPKPRMV